MNVPIPLTTLAILFWACVWASQCASDKPPEEVGAIGPDPLEVKIEQIEREHQQGREVFEKLQKDIAQTKRKTDSIGFEVQRIKERKEMEAQLNALARQPIRTDTAPCKPVPCFTVKGGDTTWLFVPKKKH